MKPLISTINGENVYLSRHPKNNFLYQFIGWGFITRIEHGDKFDLVHIKFGYFKKHSRKVIVYDNKARRQILMLKKGMKVIASGIGVLKRKEINNPVNPKMTWLPYWYLIACDFNYSYTPTAYDLKKLKKDGELEEQDTLETEYKDFYESIIDEMLDMKNGDKNDEE